MLALIVTKNKAAFCAWSKAHLHLGKLPDMSEKHRKGNGNAPSTLAGSVQGAKMLAGLVREISDDTYLGSGSTSG